jgi:hypothetical protein
MQVARHFAVETDLCRPTLGLHKPWPYIDTYELHELMHAYDRRAFERAAEAQRSRIEG